MRVVTVEHTAYRYGELSEEAKEKVKNWYLEAQDAELFRQDCLWNMDGLFGSNDLDVEFSLSYSQGDGLNICGEINAENILSYMDNTDGYKDLLTEKEKRTILHYQEVCDDVKLPRNPMNFYSYSVANTIDVAEDWECQLKYNNGYANIDTEVLRKFEKIVRKIFKELACRYEEWGYEYFYEISEEDLESNCEANNWEFDEDGNFFIY